MKFSQLHMIFKSLVTSLLLCSGAHAQQLSGILLGNNFLGGVPAVSTAFHEPTTFMAKLPETGGALLSDPMNLLTTVQAIGVPTLHEFIPIAAVLMDDPTGLANYLTAGGVILSPAVTALPEIPLLSTPLPGL